jgi:hypothetical protein
MNQQDFVASCLTKYRWETLPEGEWFEEAHYPRPKRLSSDTIQLWRRDHCAQGVLQSEEENYPCIFGDEKPFLEDYYPELLPLWEKWMAKLRSMAGEIGGETSYKRQVGIFSPDFIHSSESLSEWGRKGISITLSYVFECPCCKMRNNPGNIAKHLRSPRNTCSGEPKRVT